MNQISVDLKYTTIANKMPIEITFSNSHQYQYE